jgi:hypothetical protein
LREGCQLRVKRGATTTWQAVRYEGEDQPLTDLTPDVAREYATLAAKEFGVEKIEPVEFDQRTAEKWLALDKKVQDKLRREKPMTQQFADEPTEVAPAPTEVEGNAKRNRKGNR